MKIYNSSGLKQTWHQNEVTPRESRRNAPTREQMRLFASNQIKKLQQERIGVPSCVWTGEGLTLQRLLRITAPIIALSWLRTIHIEIIIQPRQYSCFVSLMNVT